MKIEIADYSTWKFPNNHLNEIYWIWFSEKHSSIFFSLEGKVVIYNEIQKGWKAISLDKYDCESNCAEALTTTDNYLVFAGFGGDFELYVLPEVKKLKTIDTENSGYGAASFKNKVFINNHEPFGIKMLELPGEQIIREFPVEEVLESDEYLLNSISCNEEYVTGFFESSSILEENKPNYYYITWNFHDGTFTPKIYTDWDGYEDPLILEDNLLVAGDKIHNLITSDVVFELELSDDEHILTALDNYIFTYFEEENEIQRIKIYDKHEKDLFKEIEFKANGFHTFKNRGDYFLILKENYFHLVPVKKLVKLL